MALEPNQPDELREAGRSLTRALPLSLVLGVLALLALVIWVLRMGGAVWR